MKQNHIVKWVAGLLVLAIAGFGSQAFAGRGMGWSNGPGTRCGGPQNVLKGAELEKWQAEHDAFLKSTASLRDNMYQKELEIQSELARETPDSAKALNLQKELSQMEAGLDQKRLEHQIKMKKLFPEAYRGGMGMGGCCMRDGLKMGQGGRGCNQR